jgi:hypothetical protein
MINLLFISLAFAQCSEPQNVNQLKALSNHLKPKSQSVALNPDRPWIQVKPHERDWALWHNGYLKADGDLK